MRDIDRFSRAVLRGYDPEISEAAIAELRDRALAQARTENGDIWVFGKYLRAMWGSAVAEHYW